MGGDDKATTSTVEPWSGAQPYLKDLMAGIQEQYRKQLLTDQTKQYIGMGDDQLAALEQLQNYYAPGGGFDAAVNPAMAGWQAALQDPTKVAQSKEIKDMITATTNPMYTQLTDVYLPEIRSGATGAGQYGSTRQGVAEGVAAGQTNRAAADVGAQITGQVYQNALQQRMQALNLAPLMTDLGSQGAKNAFDIENILRGEAQAKSDLDYWNRTQAEWGPISHLAQYLFPAAGLGSTQTTQMPGLSTGQRVGGAAATGLGAYGALASAGSAAAGPVGWMAALAAMLATQ